MKRKLSLLLAMVLVLSFTLTACGGGSGEEGSEDQGSGEKLKMALILSGPANDQGWNATAVEGLEQVKNELGYETTYIENIQLADTEASFRDYASQGYNLIMGHGFQFGEPALRVAQEFPDAYFASTESNSSGENMASYVVGAEQGAYIMGLIAGSMSEDNKIGVVGGFEQPSIIKEVEAFKLGVKEVKPEAEIFSAYINSYTDVTAGSTAANSMIDKGADVLYHVANQAGTGVIKSAEEAGILAFGNSYDQNSIAPDTVVCSTVYNIPKVILEAAKQVKEGTFEGGIFNMGMAEGVVEIAPYHGFEDKVPAETKELVNKKIEEIKNGSFEVPIVEQAQ